MRIEMRFMQKETPLNDQEMKDYLTQQLVGFSPLEYIRFSKLNLYSYKDAKIVHLSTNAELYASKNNCIFKSLDASLIVTLEFFNIRVQCLENSSPVVCTVNKTASKDSAFSNALNSSDIPTGDS